MACRAAFWRSGCRRKFHSCGTRSPARTRRWDLMRLRMEVVTMIHHRGTEGTKRTRILSFPNSCLGTHVLETLFPDQAPCETGVSGCRVPKQEFGNEIKSPQRGPESFVVV